MKNRLFISILTHWLIILIAYPNNLDKTGALLDQSIEVNEEAKFFYLNHFRNTLTLTQEFEILDVNKTDYEFTYIKKQHPEKATDYQVVSQSLGARYLFLSTVITKGNLIKLEVNVFDGFLNEFVFNYFKEEKVEKFSEIIEFLDEFHDRWEKNKSIISITGNPNESSLKFFNNLNQQIHLEIDTTPINALSLNPGNYTLKLTKKGYRNYQFNASLSSGNKHLFKYSMYPYDKALARKSALAFPGLGHTYLDNPIKGAKWKRRGLVMVTATALAGYYFLDSSEKYNDLHNEYLNKETLSEINDARGRLGPAMNTKNTALSILASTATSAFITWIWNYFDLNAELKKI